MGIEQLEWIRTVVSVLGLFFSVCTFFYVLYDKRQRASVKSIDELRKSIDQRFSDKNVRLNNLEREVNKIPSRQEFDAARERSSQEITRIHQRVDEINSGIKESQLLLGELIGLVKGAKNG